MERMGLFQKLLDFFKKLFNANHPDNARRQALRKLEANIRDVRPVLYKNGLIQPNFAEIIRILFENTKIIDDVLSETLCSEDLQRNNLYEEQLLMTGFNSEAQELIGTMTYEARKEGAKEAQSIGRFFEQERRKLEKVIKLLNSQEMHRIEKIIVKIKQLFDICRFNYGTLLKLFDQSWIGSPSYTPDFVATSPELLETSLADLYYVCADMDITNGVAQGILALDKLRYKGQQDDRRKKNIISSLQQLQGIFKKVLTSDVILTLYRISRGDSECEIERAVYKEDCRQKYASFLESKFMADQERLKIEIQDETIEQQVQELFADRPMELVQGYTSENDMMLRQSTQYAFTYIVAMQVLKTFNVVYYSDNIKSMLNDIIIEGFFNVPTFKSDFSSCVYACNEVAEEIHKFEDMFKRSAPFDEALISSLIRDSHRDADFHIKLKDLTDNINRTAKELLQTQANNFYKLYKIVDEILVDSKKPQPDTITNLKVLMNSSRNRDASEQLEVQYPLWKVFLEIMKNYVIIGNTERN